MDYQNWIYIFNLFGTFVFAISGALAGIKKNMDVFGMLVLAIAASSGGGILRSIFIGDYPLEFLEDPAFLIAACSATLLVFYGRSHFKKYKRLLVTFDAIGLSIFLSIGVGIALDNQLSLWASVLLGIITASFGGILRDVLSAEVPLIFRKDLYATSALAGGILYVVLFKLGAPQAITIIAASMAVFVIRELAIKYGLSLPR